MASIPRKNYAQAHLEEVRFLTGIDDWFSFLDRPDRMVYLMQRSKPPTVEFIPLEAGVSTWDWLAMLTGPGNFYGLWVNTTPEEYWIQQQILKRNEEWWAICGFYESDSEEARAIVKRYEALIRLAAKEAIS